MTEKAQFPEKNASEQHVHGGFRYKGQIYHLQAYWTKEKQIWVVTVQGVFGFSMETRDPFNKAVFDVEFKAALDKFFIQH